MQCSVYPIFFVCYGNLHSQPAELNGNECITGHFTQLSPVRVLCRLLLFIPLINMHLPSCAFPKVNPCLTCFQIAFTVQVTWSQFDPVYSVNVCCFFPPLMFLLSLMCSDFRRIKSGWIFLNFFFPFVFSDQPYGWGYLHNRFAINLSYNHSWRSHLSLIYINSPSKDSSEILSPNSHFPPPLIQQRFAFSMKHLFACSPFYVSCTLATSSAVLNDAIICIIDLKGTK